MKYLPFSQTQKIKLNAACTIYEYGGNDVMDGAIAQINGRYPEAGWAKNTVSTEMVYVLEGTGAFVMKNQTLELAASTVVLIERGEQYHFNGEELRIFIATAPPWTPEQHVIS